jgi:xanthine dehydrogenase accessory factor
MALVFVRGIGDVGSAVAHRLFQAGNAVVIQDSECPAYTRRGMAFTNAMFDGIAELANVIAKRARDEASLRAMVKCRRAVAVSCEDALRLVDTLKPDIVIDARMRKRAYPEKQIGIAPLTIGLGPNFVAGQTTDIVIETSWGERLGTVITQGPSLPLAGEPNAIAGHGRDRFVYAEADGQFLTELEIGVPVSKGDIVGMIGPAKISAPLTGELRGLTHSGVTVVRGTKIVEVDPRGESAIVRGLGERPAKIAEGVYSAICSAGFL